MANDGETYGKDSDRLTRRQLIRKGMAAGGLALWSTPLVVVGLRHSSTGTPQATEQEEILAPLGQTIPCGGMGSGDPCRLFEFCGTALGRNCGCWINQRTGSCACVLVDFAFATSRCAADYSCPEGYACVFIGEIGNVCFPLCDQAAALGSSQPH